jgi:hypothetical protein
MTEHMNIGAQSKFLNLSSQDLSASIEINNLSPEAGEFLTLILDQLENFPGAINGMLLFSHNPGIDRLQLLQYLASLFENPQTPQWTLLLQHLGLGDNAHPKKSVKSIFIQVPTDPSIDLKSYFLENLWQDLPASWVPGLDETADDLLARMKQVSALLVKQSIGMLILKNLPDRIRQLNDHNKFQYELRIYRLVSEAFSRNGILTILLGDKESFIPGHWPYLPLESKEAIDRCYSWIKFTNDVNLNVPNLSWQEVEFHGRLQLLIYDWIKSEIPAWRPERSPRYRHASQALTVKIPEGDLKSSGLVYFKNVFDPYWSDEDIVRLENSPLDWAIMILNPCEHFNEFEIRLREIVTQLPILMIWRPDTPSNAELETLRSLVLGLPSHALEGEFPDDESIYKIQSMLNDLFIHRGHLFNASNQYALLHGLDNESTGCQISAHLSKLSLKKVRPAMPLESTPVETENQRNHWAALLTDITVLHESTVEAAREQLLAWLKQSVDTLSTINSSLPEDFRTTRFWNEVKIMQSLLPFLNTTAHDLYTGSISLPEAVDHFGSAFSWDEERLLHCKHRLNNLSGLIQWIPAFTKTRDYLNAAFPFNTKFDVIRESILQTIGEPHRFLEAGARNEFDIAFKEFKKEYSDAYFTLHENALHSMNALKKDEFKIDSIALHNLELLSNLQNMDKIYLNRVKLMGRWIQYNNCSMPLKEILELYPRCYCNFNPCSHNNMKGSIPEINRTIEDGIKYFRKVLRQCGHLIMLEFNNPSVDDDILKQVTALLSDGPMIPLKGQTITILNRIIIKHYNEFLTASRKSKIQD